MDQDQDVDMLRAQVSRYSILVGFILILVFVLPCVLFALLAKYCQKQPIRRKPTISYGDENISYHPSSATNPLGTASRDSGILDSVHQGMFGQVECPMDSVKCLEKMAINSGSGCIETWKCYAMKPVSKENERLLISAKRLKETQQKSSVHVNCLKAEIVSFLRLSPHRHILNILGTCVTSGTLHTVMMEYPLYGSLHTFLLCKRRGRISDISDQWSALSFESEKADVVDAKVEMKDAMVEELIANEDIRSCPFREPLNESLTERDHLIMAIQISSAMDYLCSKNVYNRSLSSEVVMIGNKFFLKLTGMDQEMTSGIHRQNTLPSLRRAPSGRNLFKWDAPEVIEKNDFSEKSAVWRFGMTLWEIISVGDTPFQDIPHRILIDMLRKGERPIQPDGCSTELHVLMNDCWAVAPQSRPSFHQLTERLKLLLVPYIPGTSYISQPAPRRISFNDENIRKGFAGTLSMIAATAGVGNGAKNIMDSPSPVIRSYSESPIPILSHPHSSEQLRSSSPGPRPVSPVDPTTVEGVVVGRRSVNSPSSLGSISESSNWPLVQRKGVANAAQYKETDV